ncbi:MAG: DNA-binding protein WhiA [Lachnospiraceae bacterium]|nr:DNA-binding protein WhiA [Lachnospiraceae bacterium]
MSFSSNVKEELSEQLSSARHCQIAELAAIISFCGSVRITESDRFSIRIQTENISVSRKFFTLLRKTFKIDTEITVRRAHNQRNTRTYIVVVTDHEDTIRILQATKLLNQESEVEENLSLRHNVITQKHCCRRAFLRGAFLAAGSISDPNRFYHFEIVCATEQKAEQLRELICGFEIDAKVILRKKYYVVYVKEGSQIVELLGLMEAKVSLMELENVRILKEMRNTVNRKVNCETANINKTVHAAVKQVEDITYIRDTAGFASLSQGLGEIAELRLQYPEATLKELGMMLTPSVGKSGVNHRLRKLSGIAEELRGNKEESYYD